MAQAKMVFGKLLIRPEKGSVQETLIIPLYGRKLCAEQFPTLYQDEYAAGVFHYFTMKQIKNMAIAMADRFPDGRLVFDAVGKFGRDVLMKGTLKNMGMKDTSGLFFVNSVSDLEGWSPKVKSVTRKSYMQGYYKLEDPNIKGIHRFLAGLCDSMAKMYIYRMDF